MLRSLSLLSLLPSLLVASVSTPVERYHELLSSHPETLAVQGDHTQGEIELLTRPEEIEAASYRTGRQVGVIAEDAYWIWLNDAVRFPNGQPGVYGRIVWQSSLDGPAGVSVLPYDPVTKRLYLLCQYRHATRRWQLELTGGLREHGEQPEEAARREVQEESGFQVGHLHYLGRMASDTGMTSTETMLFLAEVQEMEVASPEESEAIAGILALPLPMVLEAVVTGEIDLEVGGILRRVSVTSSHLSYALLQLLLHLHPELRESKEVALPEVECSKSSL